MGFRIGFLLKFQFSFLNRNLVAPADGQSLIARARVVRSGKTLKVCTADVFAVKEGSETLCATSLSTIMAMYGKSDAPTTKT